MVDSASITLAYSGHRSQTTPRNASPVPRNRSDIPRNAKIVPGSILAPRNDPAVPGNAGTVPGNAENQSSTRDTLPWAACTFHTLGNKVLHKTRCAKDRGRSKDTFGNRFEVYGYDADDRVLHKDVAFQIDAMAADSSLRHHRRWQSLPENAVVPLMQLMTQWQGRRRAYLGC